MYLLIMLFVCSFLELTPGKNIGKKSSLDAINNYLMKYGYLSQSNIETGKVRNTLEVSNAVKTLQKEEGLDVNGDPEDPALKKFIEEPRCGVSDRVLNDPNKPQKFEISLRTWKSKQVTWKVEKFSEDLDVEVQREIFKKAFNQWSQHLDISFYEVNARSNADIVILFARGNHGDGFNLDGPGGVFAHAFNPANGIGGDVHFDEDENWATNKTPVWGVKNPDLFTTALHEFGHSLGMYHSYDRKAVMHKGYIDGRNKLDEDDIEGIQALYGSVVNPPNPCITGVDDVILIQEEIIVFKSRWFWKFDRNGKSKNDSMKAENIWEFWQDLPLNQIIDAATELPKLNLTIFFIGRRFWLMRDKKRVESFPEHGKDVRQLGISSIYVDKIDAAMVWGINQRVYIFSGFMYWRLSNDTRRMNRNGKYLSVDESYPKLVENWLGLPLLVHAAFTNYKGETFLMWKNYYWKFNQKELKWNIKLNDPVEINQLFHCETNDARLPIKNRDVSVMQTCRQLLAMWSVVFFAVVATLFQ